MTQELVQVFKDEGTKAFQNGQYELAIEKYTKGIDILQKIQDANCDEKRAALEFNISTCYFKLEKLESSLSFAENALKYNPNYIKALYRKAAILKDLKNLEESTRFLRTILVLDPSNKEAKELSETIRSQLLQQDQENKDPLALLQKELEEFDKNKGIITLETRKFERFSFLEISLKVYQQFLLENIETPQDALKAQKKCKLGEAFLEHVIAESDMTKINYFLSKMRIFSTWE